MVYFIYQSEERIVSLKSLERGVGYSQQAVAGIVQRLEAKNIVEGLSDVNDKRVKNVKLTDKGLALAEAAKHEIYDMDASFLSIFTQKEKEEFINKLYKIYKNLDTDEEC